MPSAASMRTTSAELDVLLERDLVRSLRRAPRACARRRRRRRWRRPSSASVVEHGLEVAGRRRSRSRTSARRSRRRCRRRARATTPWAFSRSSRLAAAGEALLAQPLLGGLDVAVVGLEGLLAVHHPGAGRLAQRLDVLGGECSAILVCSSPRSAAARLRAAGGGLGAVGASASAVSAAASARRSRRRRGLASAASRSSSALASRAGLLAPAAAWRRCSAWAARPAPGGGLGRERLRRRRVRLRRRRVRPACAGAMKRPSSTASAMTAAHQVGRADGVVVAGDRRTGRRRGRSWCRRRRRPGCRACWPR